MNKEYCSNCDSFVEYKTMINKEKRLVDNLIIEYEQKTDICCKCNNEFFSEETLNFNVKSYNKAYKKIFEPITIEEIKDILIKYDIGKKPLAKILNWGEVTVVRYLNGQQPNKAHSDILKSINNSPFIMEIYLNKNKDNLTALAYKKVKNKIKQLEMEYNYSKIFIVSNYLISKVNDITPLVLQKLLYFIQGFSKYFIGDNIFDNKCEAWVHGPVYREIYDCYSYYSYNVINKNKKDYSKLLTSDELNLIDAIIKYFGCYSSDVLMNMTHLTEPWVINRKGKKINEISNNKISIKYINDYFSKIISKYDICSTKDIAKYSNDLFNKIIGKNI